MSKKEDSFDVEMYHKGVKMDGDTVEQKIKNHARVLKTYPDMTLERYMKEHIELLPDCKEPLYLNSLKKAKDIFTKAKPYKAKNVFKVKNAEMRYLLFSIFEPSEVLKSVNSKLIDTKTVTKKQERVRLKNGEEIKRGSNFDLNDIETVIETYDDTYELYMVSKDEFKTDEDIFYVKCKDACSDRKYILFVEPSIGIKGDALEAIASTMRIDGEPITVDEYLSIQTET